MSRIVINVFVPLNVIKLSFLDEEESDHACFLSSPIFGPPRHVHETTIFPFVFFSTLLLPSWRNPILPNAIKPILEDER